MRTKLWSENLNGKDRLKRIWEDKRMIGQRPQCSPLRCPNAHMFVFKSKLGKQNNKKSSVVVSVVQKQHA